MTREEAIKILRPFRDLMIDQHGCPISDAVFALDMAIESLQEPKTIIGIDIPYGSDKGVVTIFKGKDEQLILEEVKEIMAVVRCKDCRFRKKIGTLYYCDLDEYNVKDADFCSWGERREE